MRPRLLVISHSPLGAGMSGPAIRAWEMARALAPVADVTLAGPQEGPVRDPPGEVVAYRHTDPRALRSHIAVADAVLAQPQWPVVARWLARSDARLVYDLYDPEPFENLEIFARTPARLRAVYLALTLDRALTAMRTGHHLVCASRGQRDLWIGAMLGQGLIGFDEYARDPTLLSRIDTVPFGVDPAPPRRVPGQGVRDRFPAIGPDDEVVLWNGGLWGWLDARTAVRAVARLATRRPGVHLVFMGAARGLPAERATAQVRALAVELGLLDRVVHLNDRWVPYAERGGWLLDADCALSAHVEHLETRFAFRTRLLDCFWAGLPVVCTRGDDLADRVARDGLGASVPPEDPEAMARALEGVLDRGRVAYAPALARAAADHAWPAVVAPIARWLVADERPPPLGAGIASPATARAGRGARAAGYRLARAALNRAEGLGRRAR